MTIMTDKLKQISSSSDPWYKDGLRFECTGCGQCCTGAPGYIWVNYDEIKEIAQFLNLDLQTFSDRYLRKVKGRFSLREDAVTYDCTFLKDNKCSIYSVRPTQCRTFPWWPTLLKSKEEWQAAAKFCEGISTCAPVVPLSKIKNQLDEQLTQKPLEVDP
jgi:Fe-S-cluster containining protein